MQIHVYMYKSSVYLFSDNVLKTVLSLYMENPSLPLPTFEEVLICNEQTTEEEVQAFYLLYHYFMGLHLGYSSLEESSW